MTEPRLSREQRCQTQGLVFHTNLWQNVLCAITPCLPHPLQAEVTAGPLVGLSTWQVLQRARHDCQWETVSGPAQLRSELECVPPTREQLSAMTLGGPAQPLAAATSGPSATQAAVSEPFSQWSEWNGSLPMRSEVRGGSSPSPWGHTAYPACGQPAGWGPRAQTGAVSRAPEPSPRPPTGPA